MAVVTQITFFLEQLHTNIKQQSAEHQQVISRPETVNAAEFFAGQPTSPLTPDYSAGCWATTPYCSPSACQVLNPSQLWIATNHMEKNLYRKSHIKSSPTAM